MTTPPKDESILFGDAPHHGNENHLSGTPIATMGKPRKIIQSSKEKFNLEF
ncbi:hypothetical protein [Holospora elegans]|uniref:hypothetical protein n=1 Tax=Holospora elegans TaxID=431043 RepID=UPI00139F2C1E|nr:hypothetical protein [Holospora elegans]